MRRLLTTMIALGLGAAATNAASAQGPVREGLRRTGEIAVGGTQRVIQGTGQVVQGAAQATRGVGEATLNAAGATAQGVRNGVSAVTPGLPMQARAGANLSAAEQGRDARWRFSRHNNEWWYYSPENRWMYHRDGNWNEFADDQFQPMHQQEQRYSMGYRGDDGASHSQYGGAQHVRTDHSGRQYICENGRAVYLDHSGSQFQGGDHHQADYHQGGHHQGNPQQGDQYQAGQQNQPQLADGPVDQAPLSPAEAGPAAAAATGEAQVGQPSAGSATEANPGNADSAGNGPEAPREVNNNPAPAQGSGAQTGAAKVQTPQ